MNIPKYILTLIRVALIPIFILLFYMPFHWSYLAAAVVFTLASITDWLDGYLARKLQQSTPFGAFLDPVADKLMCGDCTSAAGSASRQLLDYRTGRHHHRREIVISALREWRPRWAHAPRCGVAAGQVQNGAADGGTGGSLANPPEFTLWVMLGYVLLALSAVLTLWSMVVYLIAAWPHLRPNSDQNSAQ
ncbi:CDP-diacylglycerol--glycerol-3-phosphate 3-phosphatidyltransferase [Halopseudomonas pachastrellae]|nr:CDP-diacylglycerol--glycerol-3-phosphate 3-phosphatidyltransferase [Halopseudomonas pachastrellae]